MKKRISVHSSKAKGREFQKWVCQRIANIFEIEYKQDDDLCHIHSREGGQSGTDIVFRCEEIYNAFHFDIECKRTEILNLYKAIDQAKKNTKENRDWLVVHKKSYHEPIAIISWTAFENLMRQIIKVKVKGD